MRRATGAPLDLDPLLQERNFGNIRGAAYADLPFDMFAEGYAPPGGESWETFHARVDRAWDLVRARAAETDGHLAVVTHGLVCRSLAGRHVLLPSGATVPERWENTSVTILDGPTPWRVRLLNCVAHLDGLTEKMGGLASGPPSPPQFASGRRGGAVAPLEILDGLPIVASRSA